MSDFNGISTNDLQKQPHPGLSEAFLQALVQELDHEDIVGITLGGSYARGAATCYSDVDLICFWRPELQPPPKRFIYRQGKLISIKMATVAEIRSMLQQPQSAIFFANGKHHLLLDKDGSIAQLFAEIEAFQWHNLQAAAHDNVSVWMMLKAEDMHKILSEFQKDNMSGLAFVISKLVAELTLLTALFHGILITSDSTYYQQVQTAAGLDSAWTRYHRIATGLQDGPTNIACIRARGIAVLYLYKETLAFARPTMRPEHLAIAEKVPQVIASAIADLPFSDEEQQWLKDWAR